MVMQNAARTKKIRVGKKSPVLCLLTIFFCHSCKSFWESDRAPGSFERPAQPTVRDILKAFQLYMKCQTI
jgi:hypothetical protein